MQMVSRIMFTKGEYLGALRSEENVIGVCQGLCVCVSHQYKSYFLHRRWRLVAIRSEFGIRTLFWEHVTLSMKRLIFNKSQKCQSMIHICPVLQLTIIGVRMKVILVFHIKLTRIQAYQDSLADGCEYISLKINTRSLKHCL